MMVSSCMLGLSFTGFTFNISLAMESHWSCSCLIMARTQYISWQFIHRGSRILRVLVKSQLQPYIVNVVLSEPNDPSTKQMSILVYLPRTQDININLSIIINSQYIRLIGSLAIYLASSLGIDDLQSQGLVLVEVNLDGGLVVVDA